MLLQIMHFLDDDTTELLFESNHQSLDTEIAADFSLPFVTIEYLNFSLLAATYP